MGLEDPNVETNVPAGADKQLAELAPAGNGLYFPKGQLAQVVAPDAEYFQAAQAVQNNGSMTLLPK